VDELKSILQFQRSALLKDGFPGAEVRIDRLDRIADINIRYKDRILDALNEDFGGRPHLQSLFSDVISTVMEVKETRKQVRRWMKPEKRKAPLPMRLVGGRAEVQFQPLGVVGNIAPWNFPIALAFSPTIGAVGAGNRVMIKPSEATPHSAEVVREMVESAFDPSEIAVVTGGVEVGQAFSKLPFDHLVFTGGPGIARDVMASAAENLVPVTLELGGKCPVVVGKNAKLQQVAERVMAMKTLNSGQLCLTPDYIFLPEGQTENFLEAAMAVLGRFYESLLDNPDYTAIINERHWNRLRSYLDELKSSTTRMVEFNPADESFDSAEKHKLPVTFIVEPDNDLMIMQDEIFGPILSLKTYRDIKDVVDFINAKPRPLALYYFGRSREEIDLLCKNTTSGGVTINDVAQHAACSDLPLAGVGNSGMGSYHGRDGFLQFSHKKAVYRQGLFSMTKFMTPPFTPRRKKIMESML
jgi:coniferyl-aldehyde dehydrogenase